MSFVAFLIALFLFVFLAFGFSPFPHQAYWGFSFLTLGFLLGAWPASFSFRRSE